jgi:hypothetical protein
LSAHVRPWIHSTRLIALQSRTFFNGAGQESEPGCARWCNPVMPHRAAPLLVALAMMLVVAAPAQAAAPNYILVSGPGITRPILMANWGENGKLLSALVDIPRAKGTPHGLADRPRFDLAMFWGWGGRPRPTRPSQANQHGWFYPAHHSKPPIIVIRVNGDYFPRLVPARVLKIFAGHHIPLRR